MRNAERVATDSAKRSRGRLALALLAVMSGLLVVAPRHAGAREPHARSAIAHVRYILRGLTVQPPHRKAGKGKLQQSLYAAYTVQTLRRQKASFGYLDGTLLHMNQLTYAVLASVRVVQVKSGEIQQLVTPGTDHRIQTAAASVSAVGTRLDVRVRGKVTVVVVLEGAVKVQNRRGSVTATTGEQVTVRQGKKPGNPQPANLQPAQGWASGIPGPLQPLGLNVALSANGGSVHVSSSRASSAGSFDPANAIDGRLDRGWQSAQGAVTDQWLIIRLPRDKVYTLKAIMLDCAATGGEPAADDARNFEIDTSADGVSFHTVTTGTCMQTSGLQQFSLSGATSFVRIVLKDNYGGADGIALAEAQVIATDMPDTLGTPTPTEAGEVTVSDLAVYPSDLPLPSGGESCGSTAQQPAAPVHTSDLYVVVRVTIAKWGGTHTGAFEIAAPDGTIFAGSAQSMTETDLSRGAQRCRSIGMALMPAAYAKLGTWVAGFIVDGHLLTFGAFTLLKGPDRIVYSGSDVQRAPSPLPANSCTSPDEQTSSTIHSTDADVVVNSHFSVWQGSHTIRDEYHAPDGSLYASRDLSSSTEGPQSWCFPLQVAGTKAASLLGTWTFDLLTDGQQVGSVTFSMQQ